MRIKVAGLLNHGPAVACLDETDWGDTFFRRAKLLCFKFHVADIGFVAVGLAAYFFHAGDFRYQPFHELGRALLLLHDRSLNILVGWLAAATRENTSKHQCGAYLF